MFKKICNYKIINKNNYNSKKKMPQSRLIKIIERNF